MCAAVALLARDSIAYCLRWTMGGRASGTVPGSLQSVATGGGALTTISKGAMCAIALDDTYVYWLKGGDVIRLPK